VQDNCDSFGPTAEVGLHRVGDRLRLAPGDVEAATGEVVGLVRGKRQRKCHRHHPAGDDPAAPSPKETRQSNHQLAHWLVGQSSAAPAACL
jgi:hypothetical protein